MISFDDAARIIATIAKPLPPQTISLADADARVLANPVVASFDFPSQPTSAMDGYAVQDEDLAALPATLEIIGASYAGAGFAGPLRPGTCIRIFTGAPLPDGAERVVIQEEVTNANGQAHFAAPLAPRRHIRATGSDFKAGETLLPSGTILNPQKLVAVAAADLATITVVRAPRVLTIACGDELVPAGTRNGNPGKAVDSLSGALAALVRRWHGTITDRWMCGDDLARLQQAAKAAVTGVDVVVVTGGASVGEKDFAKAMFAPLDLQLHFNKVAIRPGKPVWLGQVGSTLVMGLPGNPTSALVTARLFLAPLLAGLSGRAPGSAWQWQQMRLAAPLGRGGEREAFVRAQAQGDCLVPVSDQDSAAQKALAMADYLIRQRPDDPPRSADALVAALSF